MRFKPKYLLGIGMGVGLFAADVAFLMGTRWFLPVAIIAISIFWIQFWLDVFRENKRQKQVEMQFLEFMRNLTESVKSGISIPKSIIHIAKKDFKELNPYIEKLANQIEWGIPTQRALLTFASDTQNKVIKRSISIIIEAEQSGGNIADILISVVDSVVNVKQMREERRSSTYSQVMQGYLVFYIFIGIMLSMQLWLFPKLVGLSGDLQSGGVSSGFSLDRIFFSLVLIQGFFAGIMIGKFSEGSIKHGLIHSLILMTTAALLVTTLKGTL